MEQQGSYYITLIIDEVKESQIIPRTDETETLESIETYLMSP